MIKIYRDINGVKTEKAQISDKNAHYKSAIMGLNEVQVSVTVDAVLDIAAGDYIEYGGVKYTLNRDAEFEIENDVKYSYDLIFEHPQYRLIDKLVAHMVTGSTNFIMTGKLSDFVELIVWCVNQSSENSLGVDTGWTVGAIIETEYKNITFTDVDCREALKILADSFKAEFYFSGIGKTINFVENIENTTSFVFENGREKGLYKITQQNVDKEDTVTRVYVRGGNKNVPNQYSDEDGCLKLPENYLENFTEHSKIVERKVKFEDEFPHFLGTVATVSGENNAVITCPEIDFDVEELAVGSNARINFLTGDLMGNSFEFAWDNSLKQVTLLEKDDDVALQNADGTRPKIPSAAKKANVGDKFNFTGILMPQSYVDASITRLRAKGNKWLTFYSKKRVKFTLDIDHRWLRGKPELNAGDVVVISIPQKTFYQAIRITQIEKNIYTGAVNATVSNYLEDSWEKYNEYKIDLVKNKIFSLQDNVVVIDGIMYRDRGIWSADTATIKPYLHTSKKVDDVWNLGCKWRCMVNRTTEEPGWKSEHWQMIEGRSDARMEFDISHWGALPAGFEECILTPVVLIGNANVTADITQWVWERISGDSVSDAIWNTERQNNGRVLNFSHIDMGTRWSRTNPVTFRCTATYPASSINTITNYVQI